MPISWFPVLQAAGWITRDAAVRPLDEIPGNLFLLTLAREDQHGNLVFLPPSEGLPAHEAAAFQNLERRGLRWREVEMGDAFGVDPMPMLACDGDNFAAEAVLLPAMRSAAASLLGTDRLAVGLPRRGVVLVARADLPPEQLLGFAKLVAHEHVFGVGRELSHRTLFWNESEGRWTGLYAESDVALADVHEVGPLPEDETEGRARFERRPGANGQDYVVSLECEDEEELGQLLESVLLAVCDRSAVDGDWSSQLHLSFDPGSVGRAEVERIVSALLAEREVYETMALVSRPIEVHISAPPAAPPS